MKAEDELIISGDGKSAETAIQFRPCHILTRVARERAFVCEAYGVQGVDWNEVVHFTSREMQSVWAIELQDGTRHNVYFDTSQTIYDDE